MDSANLERQPTHTLHEHHVVQAIETQGIRLALVVSPDVARLAHFGQGVQAASGWECLAMGPQLSAWLLERQGPPTPRLLRAGVQGYVSGSNRPLLCTEIDLLFEPALRLDPLALFMQLSRQRPLIVLWPGKSVSNGLTYAVPEHAHYRIWNSPTAPEVRLFPISG